MGLRPSIDLYECDSFGLLCRFIYNYGGQIQNVVDQEPYPWVVHLIPDPATNTLALEINGEVVYTYRP